MCICAVISANLLYSVYLRYHLKTGRWQNVYKLLNNKHKFLKNMRIFTLTIVQASAVCCLSHKLCTHKVHISALLQFSKLCPHTATQQTLSPVSARSITSREAEEWPPHSQRQNIKSCEWMDGWRGGRNPTTKLLSDPSLWDTQTHS